MLHEKDTWYLLLYDAHSPKLLGIGECSPIDGLSVDKVTGIEPVLDKICNDITRYQKHYRQVHDTFPCIQFGLEAALLDARSARDGILYPSDFTKGTEGIPINGLIWMGDPQFMQAQIDAKLAGGNSCLKLKIGSLDFPAECEILRRLRARYNRHDLELRVDANGAFRPEEALQKLQKLATFHLHSIEQPIWPRQWETMRLLCEKSPVPIALDEELIGVSDPEKRNLLSCLRPQYIILKPSLLGGFARTQQWIDVAAEMQTDWWVTSALESNIGLNAIAQWVANMEIRRPQGLGTGQIYRNNISSPLFLKNDMLWFDDSTSWDYANLRFSDTLQARQ
ncbi:MAG: o-succinylbenzoate synthase [Desulfobulbus propionicus]|nr:MAG: o-succinylbenzoate synthase [Desulfobulbus propionicus]